MGVACVALATDQASAAGHGSPAIRFGSDWSSDRPYRRLPAALREQGGSRTPALGTRLACATTSVAAFCYAPSTRSWCSVPTFRSPGNAPSPARAGGAARRTAALAALLLATATENTSRPHTGSGTYCGATGSAIGRCVAAPASIRSAALCVATTYDGSRATAAQGWPERIERTARGSAAPPCRTARGQARLPTVVGAEVVRVLVPRAICAVRVRTCGAAPVRTATVLSRLPIPQDASTRCTDCPKAITTAILGAPWRERCNPPTRIPRVGATSSPSNGPTRPTTGSAQLFDNHKSAIKYTHRRQQLVAELNPLRGTPLPPLRARVERPPQRQWLHHSLRIQVARDPPVRDRPLVLPRPHRVGLLQSLGCLPG